MLSNADLLTAATQLVMAALGALARILNKHETLQLSHTLREIFVAMFTALMLFWLASALELSGGWLFVVSGVMGLMGSSALEAEARGLYDPVYNAEREGLTHQAEQNALMLEQELAGLGDSYDRAREDTAKSFDDAYSQAGNAMLSRGMQRSSYGQQIQSNIQIAGGKAQQDLNQAQAKDEGKIRATASMYDRQFNESLTRLAADYEQNVTNMRLQLEQREYDRYWQSQQAMNNLNLAIYQASLTTKQYEESIRQFNAQLAENQRQFNLGLAEQQRQFDMNYSLQAQQLAAQQAAAKASSSGGSSSSGSSSKSTTASSSSKAPTVSNSNSISEYDMIDYQRMLSQMNSSSSAKKTVTSGGHAGGNLVM